MWVTTTWRVETKLLLYFEEKEKPLINSHPKRRPIWFLHSCRMRMAIQFHELVEDPVHCQVSTTKVNWNGSSSWGMAQANYRCWKCLNGVVYQLQGAYPLKGDSQLTSVEGNDPCVLGGPWTTRLRVGLQVEGKMQIKATLLIIRLVGAIKTNQQKIVFFLIATFRGTWSLMDV